MAKIQAAGGVKKISLAQIIANGNVREDYRDIAELAESIKTNGLLQPIAVKSLGKNADGIDEYELVAGHRRRLAFQYLCDAGDDFSRIDAVVVAGDKLTLQLVENLQRSDLTARERERGIFLMTRDGKIAQSEVAALLGKNEQFVYRNASAYKIRELTDKSGIDTSEISTNTLCEIAAAADGDIPLLIEKIKEEGGTLAAARRIWREHKGDAEPKPEAGLLKTRTKMTVSTPIFPSAILSLSWAMGLKLAANRQANCAMNGPNGNSLYRKARCLRKSAAQSDAHS
ncbi:MAG: ParB/RepB/Spo0J family partition protein [Treponemataceae bacterium]|nr:MAG: ParB/RepB/Spo0J family partition protein [Treponemataceae bacterium]